jgi:predicted flap endonuclease-1-like 5' DNA nuclease
MEDFTTHLPFFLVVLLMLFGAFVIGYVFGGRSKRTVVVKTQKIQVPIKDISLKTEAESEIDNDGRLSLEELEKPGSVRATKTRERSGSLSDDAKQLIVEHHLDFEVIGKGDPDRKDDFQKIVGIGPFIEEKLYSIGIYNYEQLSRMTDKEIAGITALIDFFPGRIHRDDWKGQATQLISEKNT